MADLLTILQVAKVALTIAEGLQAGTMTQDEVDRAWTEIRHRVRTAEEEWEASKREGS